MWSSQTLTEKLKSEVSGVLERKGSVRPETKLACSLRRPREDIEDIKVASPVVAPGGTPDATNQGCVSSVEAE